MNAAAARISKALKKLLHRELDILCYLAKQDWGYISTPVEGHRCAASIGMSELFVRAPLSDLLKTEFFKHADNFFGLEYRDFHHG